MTSIIPFTSTAASLQWAGGKGSNLARLVQAGFPVPAGFIISTTAYRAFVADNHLTDVIDAALVKLTTDDPTQLETASTAIRAAFSAGQISANTAAAICAAHADLNAPAVAVRSSATAEDLPDLSFAGQQDTYLNVVGTDALLSAVIDCWSSLWSARAVGYRLRNDINQNEVALAVVVQVLVPSELSGVLFTANPLTGLLHETVIEATYGLGEALVSGQVVPDHFVVESNSGAVISKTLGSKRVVTYAKPGGGVETVQRASETSPAPATLAQQTLSDLQILKLTQLGQQMQTLFAAPQDIEWAFAAGQLYILQSRAITSLFPVPHISLDPLTVWFSFGAVQGLLGPITPLGRDVALHIAAGAGRLFGASQSPETQTLFAVAGERIWIKLSDLIRHPIGNRLFGSFLQLIEPSVAQILTTLATDPRIGASKGKLTLRTMWRVAHFALPLIIPLLHNLCCPAQGRAKFDAQITNYLQIAQINPSTDRFVQLANIVSFIRERIANAFPFLLPRFIPIFAPSMVALNLLNKIFDADPLVLEVTRGLPNNVTTEMDLALWQTAKTIRAAPDALRAMREHPAEELAESYLQQTLPPEAQTAIAHFMARYGMRGVGEIDFGQPRWREAPTVIIHTLQSYLNIDPAAAPDVLFARGAQAADAASTALAAQARRQFAGWFKEKLVRAAVRSIRLLMGVRESPKFFAIRLMGIARSALLTVGQAFVTAGTLDQADDLVFLQLSELTALAQAEQRDWKALCIERRAAYTRELRRRQVPRVLLSDGRAFYEGLGATTDTDTEISGSPVSPGCVEGVVHIVHNPAGTQLAPGEILVCRGTDPAWTPLFMAAGGLVTEVGGMMTHGSVVAREYGIPAVVGVHQATTRLRDGQHIRIDGNTGKIMVLTL
jgi:phosphohistidine swiveling domain-containing protein